MLDISRRCAIIQKLFEQRTEYGGIAQLGERLNGIQEVSGSIPLISTTQHSVCEEKVLNSKEFRTFSLFYGSKCSEYYPLFLSPQPGVFDFEIVLELYWN